MSYGWLFSVCLEVPMVIKNRLDKSAGYVQLCHGLAIKRCSIYSP
jgi:hypothetical protein